MWSAKVKRTRSKIKWKLKRIYLNFPYVYIFTAVDESNITANLNDQKLFNNDYGVKYTL